MCLLSIWVSESYANMYKRELTPKIKRKEEKKLPKQFFLLTSFMKVGPELQTMFDTSHLLGGIPFDQTSAETSEESDIQKKMIPWQSMSIPGFDDLRSEGHDRSSGGSLVLVASLVNKAPNLGGRYS